MQTEHNEQLRLFVPADLAIEPGQTGKVLAHLFSARCIGRFLRIIVVERSGAHLPYPGSENPIDRFASQCSDGRDHVQYACKVTCDHLGIVCLHLETALAACKFCQVVYYERSRPGIRHYGASHAETSLSKSLRLINHQHSARHKGKNFLDRLQVCLTASPETKYQTAYGSMLCGDIKGWLCRTGCSIDSCDEGGGTFSDVAAENTLLLQTRQRGLAAVLQRLAGVCLATFLLTHHVKCWEGIACAAIFVKTQAVEQQIQWLMGAPAGLKLHAELSHVLGSIAQMWLRYSEAAYMLIGRNTMVALTGLSAVMGVVGGLTMQIAFLHDLLCLLAMPMVIAYTAYAKLYAVQLHYTLLMWQLMRGNRDALAVLRRQYGLENSPRKRRQDTSHHNKQNGLALEQVTIV
ncbi:TPA: hypothetical protein ACH3X3_001505 [Trebouxia sp. C0006]